MLEFIFILGLIFIGIYVFSPDLEKSILNEVKTFSEKQKEIFKEVFKKDK